MFFGVLLFIFSVTSWSHQSSLTSDGNELFWANPNVPVVIKTNTADMNSTVARQIILDSMAQWNLSSSAKVNSVSSSGNEIKFVSNYPYGSGVIGVTEISYNTSGAIQKAVISLNDDYYFHDTPGMYPAGQIFLGDVVTHELGHVFGLSHSEVLDSSMFYSSFSGQSTVSLDDRSAVRQKYESTSYGSIRGTVRGGSNIGVLGAHVQAISARTGKATAVVTNEDGDFTLGGLELNDTYYLYTSPVKNLDSLPGYFANVQDEFCPASYVGSFFSKCGRNNDGKPQGVTLDDYRPDLDIGIVTINCSLRSDENYNLQKVSTTFTPVNIYTLDIDDPKLESSFVGWFRNPSTSSWSSPDIFTIDLSQYLMSDRFLKFNLVSFPLGSQLQYEVTIRNSFGEIFANAVKPLTVSSVTDTYSTDYEILIPLSDSVPEKNVFEVRIRSLKLTTSQTSGTFPTPLTFSSGTYLPYLMMSSIWANEGMLSPLASSGSVLSDNAACLDAPFTFAVSKTRNASENTQATTDQAAAAAGCGTIEPPGNGPGSSLPLLALGFFMTFLISATLKSRKNFLS